MFYIYYKYIFMFNFIFVISKKNESFYLAQNKMSKGGEIKQENISKCIGALNVL